MIMKKFIALVLIATSLLTGCNNASDNSSLQVFTDTTSQELLNGDITEYPEDNIFGLKSVREEDNGSSKTITFTFKIQKNGAVNSSIIKESNSISGLTPYGSFNFNESEVINKKNHFDVLLTYDSRITLDSVSFDFGDERCNIYLKEGLELIYCDFRDHNLTKRIHQNYNTESKSWNESYNEQETNEVSDGIGYYIYTVKEIDYSDETRYPVNTFGHLKFKATEYRYTVDRYNIYGEVEAPSSTTLRFDFISDDAPIDVDFSESNVKLFAKVGDNYTDITPADIALTLKKYDNDKGLAIILESSELGDIEEGDYRVECGEYYVDFALAIHTEEVS